MYNQNTEHRPDYDLAATSDHARVYYTAVAGVRRFNLMKAQYGGSPMPSCSNNYDIPRRGFNRFEELARLCLDNGWDIGDYIEDVFFSLGKSVPDIIGKDLLSDKAIDRYKKTQSRREAAKTSQKS